MIEKLNHKINSSTWFCKKRRMPPWTALCWVCLLLLSLLSPAFSDLNLELLLHTHDEGNMRKVPLSYLGLSHEPPSQAGYYCNDKVYQQLIKNLVAYDTGPFSIRWARSMQSRGRCMSRGGLARSAPSL